MRDLVYMAGQIVFWQLRADCPIDTGNLSQHGIWMSDDGSKIWIGGELAPYAIYTNEPWSEFDFPLKGHTNPNQNWIENAIQKSLQTIKTMLSGDLTDEEVNNLIAENQKTYQKRLDKIAVLKLEKAAEIL